VSDAIYSKESLIKNQIKAIAKDFKGNIDLRLCIDLSDSKMNVDNIDLNYDDVSFDLKHSDICGGTVINTNDFDLESIFQDLISECLDSATELI